MRHVRNRMPQRQSHRKFMLLSVFFAAVRDMAVLPILPERILRQSEASDNGLLIGACNFARACRDREGDLAAVGVLAQHKMAALAAVDKNLNRRIEVLHPLEEITEFDRLGHSSALKNIPADPGHLHIRPLKKPGGPGRSIHPGARHAEDRKVGFIPEVLDFNRSRMKRVDLFLFGK